MSHRDHAAGAAERGNDWLDGALAGWLLFIAISAGQLAWFAIRDGGGWDEIALEAAAPVLALAAIFPLLRFHRIGWILAFLTLGLMAAREGMLLASRPAAWQSTAAFLAVNLLGIAYLLWIIPEFWHRHREDEPAEPAVAAGSAESAEPAALAETAAPAGPTPVTHALAAIHQRIVAAGSACAVTPVSVRAEAGRFGVTPAALRTEGLPLYRTFLQHFLADGSLSADEERELICLERALDLDDDGVWRLRGEAGLRGGFSPTAPALTPEPLASPVDADDAILPPADADALATRAEIAAAPHPSAQSDIASSEPHSPEAIRHEPFALDAPAAEDEAAGADILPSDAHDEPASADLAEAAARTESSPPDIAVPADETASADLPFEVGTPSAPDGLADYEEHELGALLRWTGIPALPAGTAPRAALERLRALHRTGTEPLQACASDQPLEPGESCLATRTVELYRVPGGAAPPAADVPGPVLDPRALVDGSVEQDRDLSGFQRTGVCRFVLTERRLLLVAPSGQQSPLPVSRLRAVRPYRNGLEVQPQRGSSVFLAFTGGVDDVAMRIDRAARDLRASA